LRADVTLQVGPSDGGIELRQLADDDQPEHRLRLSVEQARELVRLLLNLLELRGGGMSPRATRGEPTAP
jgi:hypothetical protein